MEGVTPALSTLVSMAASLAIKEGNAEQVREMLGADPAVAAQFDMAYLVQSSQADPGAQRLSMRTAEEVEKRRAARHAAQVMAEEEKEALRSGEAEPFELLSSMDLENLEEAETLIEGFLVKESVVRLYGPPKSFKSFVMLDMAACVGAGIPWAGNNTVASKVLYIVAEGARGIRRRARAWEAQNKRPMTGVHFYPKAVQLGERKEVQRLIATARHGNYEFIILDTQARCTVGLEENSASEMGLVVAALDVLKEVTGACVALVHHSGAAGGRARGSTAILGALDAEFEVEADKYNMSVKVKTRAQKDLAEAKEIELDLVTPAPGAALAVKARPDWYKQTIADLPELSARQKSALIAIAQYGDIGVTAGGLAKRLNANSDDVRVTAAELLRAGTITVKGGTMFLARTGALYIRHYDQQLRED